MMKTRNRMSLLHRTQNRMVKLVEWMPALDNKAKGTTKTAIERRIKATDRQIDELVYALYELGDDEIRIIERER